uniref:Uncharacterized protein n=1 Tax=Seriola dumerili TaxID=41447 RepID=A0A3B4TNB6_SERDU
MCACIAYSRTGLTSYPNIPRGLREGRAVHSAGVKIWDSKEASIKIFRRNYYHYHNEEIIMRLGKMIVFTLVNSFKDFKSLQGKWF